MNFLTTGDRTRLFVKDWGFGRPVIFLHIHADGARISRPMAPLEMNERDHLEGI